MNIITILPDPPVKDFQEVSVVRGLNTASREMKFRVPQPGKNVPPQARRPHCGGTSRQLETANILLPCSRFGRCLPLPCRWNSGCSEPGYETQARQQEESFLDRRRGGRSCRQGDGHTPGDDYSSSRQPDFRQNRGPECRL
jgi:hypothetical protein